MLAFYVFIYNTFQALDKLKSIFIKIKSRILAVLILKEFEKEKYFCRLRGHTMSIYMALCMIVYKI